MSAAGAGAAAGGEVGASGVGARAVFGAACFLAVWAGGDAGRDSGSGADKAGAAARDAEGAGALPGSGVMMLTGGVDAADGKSALVGLPVGIVVGSAATWPAAGGGGAFQDPE